jgi:hypothetical protein
VFAYGLSYAPPTRAGHRHSEGSVINYNIVINILFSGTTKLYVDNGIYDDLTRYPLVADEVISPLFLLKKSLILF